MTSSFSIGTGMIVNPHGILFLVLLGSRMFGQAGAFVHVRRPSTLLLTQLSAGYRNDTMLVSPAMNDMLPRSSAVSSSYGTYNSKKQYSKVLRRSLSSKIQTSISSL